MATIVLDKMTLKTRYHETAQTLYNKSLGELGPYELNSVIAKVIKNDVISKELKFAESRYSENRIAIYFSIEYLLGRIVIDALNNVGLLDATREIFEEEGVDILLLEDVDDTALGNGGLGRLSACFVESAATMGLPLYGAGLYYEDGFFKQTFDESGWQKELPDRWTENGEPWFTPLNDEAEEVYFQDTVVRAVPYVLPVIGHHLGEGRVFPLTLWKAEPIEGRTNDSARRISKTLYPSDETDDGKILRIRQEYTFVSAQLKRIFRKHLEKHKTLDNIEEFYVFQMNDTHPVMGCLEFIRLLKENGYSFEIAFEKAKKCFAYTNHTIMAEALESWPIGLFKNILPDIFKVIEELNQVLVDTLRVNPRFCTPTNSPDWEHIGRYELFKNGTIYMARIACFVAFSINGVAEVHSNIIKKHTLHGWYKLYPSKFTNVTNGVTQRRWCANANPGLNAFLNKYAGPDWVVNLEHLENLERYKNSYEVLTEYASVKYAAKVRLANYIKKHEGIEIDPNSIFDCQVKRFHEYKRQHMNALRILYIYDQIKSGNLKDMPSVTFIIGGKSAPSYYSAKLIMQLLKDIQDMVNNDPDVNQKIKVVVLTNFNVSYGEMVYAAADFSEQISQAGMEASGTGNMKFMLNGGITIGTMDGANIEIVEEAGIKNEYIFGASVDEFKRIRVSYRHDEFLAGVPHLTRLFDYLKGRRNLKRTYWEIATDLQHDDRYKVMYDLESYIEKSIEAFTNYGKEKEKRNFTYHTRKAFLNTARSAKFTSDRTIAEYASSIWRIAKV